MLLTCKNCGGKVHESIVYKRNLDSETIYYCSYFCLSKDKQPMGVLKKSSSEDVIQSAIIKTLKKDKK